MSRRRTERLINLVLCLLSSRRFLTANQIAQTVAGYEHDPSDPKAHEAFQRMFERDKAELRELGVPLETGIPGVFETEVGYRIAPDDYQLPDIELEPAEAAAIGLAARIWRTAGLASAASNALRKLQAAGMELDTDQTLNIEPNISVEPVLDTVMTATRQRQLLEFTYQRPGDLDPIQRRVQPWGVVCWHGHWYLVAYDQHRNAPRCFRLSRILGAVTLIGAGNAFSVPENLDLVSYVVRAPAEKSVTALLRIEPGMAAGLQRVAKTVEIAEDGTCLATLDYSDQEQFAAHLVGYGPHVQVLEPPELQAAVISRLQAIAHSLGDGEVRQ